MRPISAILLPNMIAALTAINKGYLELSMTQRIMTSTVLSFAILFCWVFGGGDSYFSWIKEKWTLLQKLEELKKKDNEST